MTPVATYSLPGAWGLQKMVIGEHILAMIGNRKEGGMLKSSLVSKILKALPLLGVSLAFTLLAYVLEQQGGWSWLQLLLGAGAVLAFYGSLGRGIALNLPLAMVVSLLALAALYVGLGLAFPEGLARRVEGAVADPFVAGVLLALFLFRPGYPPTGRSQQVPDL